MSRRGHAADHPRHGHPGFGDADTDADTDADPPDGLPLGRLAVLSVSDALDPPRVAASFYAFDPPATAPPTPATGSTFGDCTVNLDAGTASPPSYTLIEPGAVVATLDGYDLGIVGTGGTYLGTLSSWPTDAVLGLSASGDEFPAFSMGSLLTVPSFVALVEVPYEADRSADLLIQWVPGNADLRVSLHAIDADVLCTFDDAAGVGTVPAEALALLPVGSVELDIYRFAHTERVLSGGAVVLGEAIPHNAWQAKLR